jgi:hypothetical protein
LQIDIAEIQKLVEKLDGVIGAKCVQDDEGLLSEIHILADKSRAPKQLSRDIQSAIAATSGMNIDNRIISIAQIGDDVLRPECRLRINNIQITSGNATFSVTVGLLSNAKIYTGTASSTNTSSGRYNTTAQACLNAIHEFLSSETFHVSDVQKIKIAMVDEINVAVSYYYRGSERLLTGTSIVTNDDYNAIVRATLDAVNRVLPTVSE